MAKQKNQTNGGVTPSDALPKVTGIGGIFFFTENPKKIKEWYAKNLGLEINEWGSSSFESRNIERSEKVNALQWCTFKKKGNKIELWEPDENNTS
jgi:hypothetical protein